MQTKTCTTCEIEKPISEYNKQKRGKYGVKSNCKLCQQKNAKIYYEKNKEKRKDYYEKNKEKFDQYRKKNKEKIKKRHKKYRDNNREKINEYYEKNKEKKKEYYEKNKEKKLKYVKEYRKNNRDKINEYHRDKRKNDIQYKLMKCIRSRLSQFLKYKKIYKERNTTILSIGCSKEHLTDWIKYNIDLDNLNEYHIDHVRPLVSFNCKTYEEVIETKCNHWTNLMPTSPEYNLSKCDREPTKHELFKQELRIKLFKLKSIVIK